MLRFVRGITLFAIGMLVILASGADAQAFQERFQKHYLLPNKIDAMHRFSAIETSDGGIIAAYVTGNRLALIKTDACGDVQWTKQYDLMYSGYTLSTDQVVIREVTNPTPAYVIAGSYASDCGAIFLVKIDASTKAVVWRKIYDGG